MGNSRTDLGEDFIASGMTLITDPRSDFYLKEDKKKKLLTIYWIRVTTI